MSFGATVLDDHSSDSLLSFTNVRSSNASFCSCASAAEFRHRPSLKMDSRNRNATSKAQNVVLNVLLKLCFVVFLSTGGTEAVRSHELSSKENIANNLALPNDLIAENPADGLYHRGEDITHPGSF